MRSTILRSLVLGLCLGGLAAITNVAQAQNVIPLMEYTNVWKYLRDGTDQGTAWRATAFNDAAWLSGRGLLGWEPGNPQFYTRAPFNTEFANYNAAIVTYYFRAHFNFPSNPCGATLTASNYIDDGAVIYLNGTEVARIRVPANQNYQTISGGPTIEGQDDVVTFVPPPGVLVQGDNVVAVEVHQQSTTSSDIVWGMNLTANVSPVPPVSITKQPHDTIGVLSNSATLCVEAVGGVPSYQWQRANSAGTFLSLSGANDPCYTINPVTTLLNAARYRVIVSSCANSQTSQVVTLTVITDVEPPKLVSAVASDTNATPTIYVTFSENMRNSNEVNTVANYAIKSVPAGSSLIVSNANLSTNRTIVQLQTSPWSTDTNYVLVVNNLRDNSANANRIASNSVVGLAMYRNLINITNDFWSLREDASTPAANWTSPNYVENPQEWFFLQQPFGFEFFSRSPLPFNTSLDYGFTTYYFRNVFDLGTNVTAAGTFRLNYLIDDGAVFYLNGREVFRYNMPASPPAVNYNTFASNSVDATAILTTGEFVVTNLTTGTNVLCVEVHQQVGDANDFNQTDVVFAAGLRAALAPDLRMTITPNRNANKVITSNTMRWTLGGVVLQGADNAVGPWSDLATGTNSYTAPVTGARKLYRLKLF